MFEKPVLTFRVDNVFGSFIDDAARLVWARLQEGHYEEARTKFTEAMQSLGYQVGPQKVGSDAHLASLVCSVGLSPSRGVSGAGTDLNRVLVPIFSFFTRHCLA